MFIKAEYKKFNESKKTRNDYISLIRDIIRLIKYYDLKCNKYGNPKFCYNTKRRFQYEKYLETLKNDLIRELTFYKWYFKRRI